MAGCSSVLCWRPASSSGTTPCRPWAPTSPPATRQRRSVQMLFLCVTAVVLLLGWFLNNGDPVRSVNRLSFPLPDLHLGLRSASCGGAADPVGAPLSTSFLVLCSFLPARPAPCWRRRWSAMHRLRSGALVYGLACGCWNAGAPSTRACGEEIRIWGFAVVFLVCGAAAGADLANFCVRAAPSRWPVHGDLHAGDLPRPLPARGSWGWACPHGSPVQATADLAQPLIDAVLALFLWVEASSPASP